MTLKEKVEEIKRAIGSGLAKRRIDVKGNGANVRKVLEGRKVSEERVEEMYAKLLENRENPDAGKERLAKYRNTHAEVPPKEKVRVIRKAVRSGMAKNALDPFGGGDAVRKLEKGKGVGAAKINEMYANLLSQKEVVAQTAAPKKTKGGKRGMASEKGLAKDKARGGTATDEMPNEQITALLQKVRILEDKVGQLSEAVNPKLPLKVLGLTVTQKRDIVKGKKYRRWYAIYRKDGARRWIYIGKDVKKAEEKIQSWLEKEGVQKWASKM